MENKEQNGKPAVANSQSHQLSWVAGFLRRRRLLTMGIVDAEEEQK